MISKRVCLREEKKRLLLLLLLLLLPSFSPTRDYTQKENGDQCDRERAHASGTLAKWRKQGVRWVYFFQDTNALALKVLPATLGVSLKEKLEVNSVCVPRTAGESIGGIMRISHADGARFLHP